MLRVSFFHTEQMKINLWYLLFPKAAFKIVPEKLSVDIMFQGRAVIEPGVRLWSGGLLNLAD